MKIVDFGSISEALYVQSREINPDVLHVYRYDLITEDDTLVIFDVVKNIQEWGVDVWFSNTPAGSALRRTFPVTHQTDISFRVTNGSMTLEKNNITLDFLFQINPDLTYYINVFNKQNNDNFYFLKVGDTENTMTDIC